MSRDFQIPGETLVKIRFGGHVSGDLLRELGLTIDQIHVSPQPYHAPVLVNDFGPQCPAEIMWQLASADIRMNLIHIDNEVLKLCVDEAMAGSVDGTLAPAGLTLGHGLQIFASGNHFVSLNLITNPFGGLDPYRFRTSYITSHPPIDVPLGTEVSIVQLTFHAIPYQPMFIRKTEIGASGAMTVLQDVEVISSGAVLWDRFTDID